MDFAKCRNFDQNSKFRPNFDQNSKFRPNFIKIWWKFGRRLPKSPGKFLAHTEIYGAKHHFYQICTTAWPKNFTKICKNSKFCKIWKFWSTPVFHPGFRGEKTMFSSVNFRCARIIFWCFLHFEKMPFWPEKRRYLRN